MRLVSLWLWLAQFGLLESRAEDLPSNATGWAGCGSGPGDGRPRYALLLRGQTFRSCGAVCDEACMAVQVRRLARASARCRWDAPRPPQVNIAASIERYLAAEVEGCVDVYFMRGQRGTQAGCDDARVEAVFKHRLAATSPGTPQGRYAAALFLGEQLHGAKLSAATT